VWDKDLTTAPALITIKKDGKEIEAVAQPTKNGFVFLLERETGKPIYPIEERPVPTQSELKGEKLWPTQPFPTFPKPFARQTFTENELNHLVPDSSYQDLKKRLSGYKYGNMFEPPTFQGTIFFPGLDGGGEWGGSAFDPSSQLLFVNANEMPWMLKMTEVKLDAPKKENYIQAGDRLYKMNCMACHGPDRKGSGNNPTIVEANKKYSEKTLADLISTGRRMMPAFKNLSKEESIVIASFILDLKANQKKEFNKFLTKEGYTGIKPPWGTLNAVNLSSGEIEWRIPLGEIKEFKEKGIITGSENYGGPVVTASSLLFIAATPDGKFRCFNKHNGKLLWETLLPAPGFATPSIYEVNGKQFIVIACGGGKLKTKSGDSYVAFALP